jgi:hypothetical protein
MQWIVAELLKIEETLAHELNTNKNGRSKGGRNRRHYWSGVFHRKVGISYLIESAVKCCTQKKKRPQVRTLINKQYDIVKLLVWIYKWKLKRYQR